MELQDFLEMAKDDAANQGVTLSEVLLANIAIEMLNLSDDISTVADMLSDFPIRESGQK